MPRSANQKLKLLYLIKILTEQTDSEHCLGAQELCDALAGYGIKAERKSIYDDIAQLTEFGYPIELVKARAGGGYYLASREFELAELKLLVETVQASRFITLKKSRELIKIGGGTAAAAGLCRKPDQDGKREYLLYRGRHPQGYAG